MPSNSPVPVNSTSIPHHGAPNATASAGAAAAGKARAAMIAEQQRHNQRVPQYYAVTIASLIMIIAIYRWSRFIYNRYASKESKNSSIIKAQVRIVRNLRHTLNQPIPGFTSVSHAVLVLAYLAINISLTVTNINWSSLVGIAKRCGWMAITNVAFITFLALKNTPLAFLTASSYDRLNSLHQVGGYVTVIYALLHTTLMCEFLDKAHFVKILHELPQIHGMIAATAMFIILITATLLRKVNYEAFYVTHVTMYMIILINVGFHRPDFALKTIIITIFVATMWCSDRIFRLSRIMWYSRNNRATLTPLPNGGTRIVLRRSSTRAIPGTHCFLWIPRIRPTETHPFTISAATRDSLEFVVASHDGFTKDLYQYATMNPGVALRASFDGPYGAIPNFTTDADKVILIAGGSGASFTFGVALDMIGKLEDSSKTTIDFIWTVREPELLSWYSKELSQLESSPRVNFHLHTTRSTDRTISSNPPILSEPISPSKLSSDPEKEIPAPTSHISAPSIAPSSHSQIDIEKHAKSSQINDSEDLSTLDIVSGRPDIENIIKTTVRKADQADRIIVAACGPDGLMKIARKAAADCITAEGPSIELHCEKFGW